MKTNPNENVRVLSSGSCLTDAEITTLSSVMGDFRKIDQFDLDELSTATNIPVEKLINIKSSIETVKRLYYSFYNLPSIRSPEDAHNAFRFLQFENHEQFWLGIVDNGGRLTSRIKIKTGSTSFALLTPAELFREVFKLQGHRIVLVHNHPSGNITPSDEDLKFTKLIAKAAKLLGIELLDHVIIGAYASYSFREHLLI